jgi:vanillate O-demethylase ferredoxin subunit
VVTGDLISVRVKSIAFEAEQINSYVLKPVAGQLLPAFTAGSHIDLHLANGMIRNYSLLNDASETDRYVIAVKRDAQGRGGSRFVHDMLRAGDVVSISRPSNNFEFNETASYSLFLAGGIGITPILAMVRRVVALGRRWELHYAARTRIDAAFLDELAALGSGQGGEVHVTFDREPGATMLDVAAIAAKAAPEAHLYCCGPLPMLEAFEAAVTSRPRHQIHVEYFSAEEAPAAAGGFEVRLNRSGRVIPVISGKTILETLLDAGVNVSYACSEGVCGACETRVVEGIPDHRDIFLSDEEKADNKQIMICCSGSKTPVLVLDL